MATCTPALQVGIKQQIVESWVRRKLGRIDHERRVLNIAQQMFSLTSKVHGLSHRELRLLSLGVVLHDVGRSIEEKRHPQIGARMITDDASMPLTQMERRQLAYLTRYHRGVVPEIGYDDYLQRGDERKKMRLLLAILRAADALDCRQSSKQPDIQMRLRNDKLKIRCAIDSENTHMARYLKRRKKLRLMEELLDLKIMVEVAMSEALSL